MSLTSSIIHAVLTLVGGILIIASRKKIARTQTSVLTELWPRLVSHTPLIYRYFVVMSWFAGLVLILSNAQYFMR